jgi:hypothetical protein
MATAGLVAGAELMTDELPTTHPVKKYSFVKAEDSSEWANTPYGKLGVARLQTAPFPDDSRTTGFQSKRGFFPYEGHYDDNRVAFVVPQEWRANGQKFSTATQSERDATDVDLIVHFHGHMNECLNVVETFHLGEQLAASGKRAVLIVPQGPKYAPDSGCGKLEKEGAFAAFVAEAMQVLKRNETGIGPNARLNHIIVSGHSGAYRVIAKILEHGGEWDRIREVWLFDAAYGFFDELALPATSPSKNPKLLRSIFTDHLAPENAEIMSRVFLAGHRPAVVTDDLLSTRSAWLTKLQERAGKRESLPTLGEALEELLHQEPYLFIYTHLGHNELLYERHYFEHFARSSPNLQAFSENQSGRERTPKKLR